MKGAITMKTHLSEDKLAYFREKLLNLKSETKKLLERTPEESPNDAIQELADYGNHPGDMGTEQFEQEREAGMELVHQEKLNEVNAALDRIDNGTYGLSEKSGKPIPEERLEAIPTARLLVEESE